MADGCDPVGADLVLLAEALTTMSASAVTA
jgi:hypothetical protein